MVRAIRFWWACVRDAAEGTVEKANAWFWPIGIPIVALAGRYWEMGELTIPDTAPGFVAFMMVTVAISWVVFFAIRLVGAPARIYARLEDKKNELEAELEQSRERRATLEVRLDSKAPYSQQNEQNVYRRFGLYNRGPAVADHVTVKLYAFPSPPTIAVGILDLPLSLYQSSDPDSGQINPNDEVFFTVLEAYPDREGARPSTRWRAQNLGRGHSSMPMVYLEHGRQWEFNYRVQAANANEIIFTLVVSADANGISVSRKD